MNHLNPNKRKGFVKLAVISMSFCQALQFTLSPVLQKIQLAYGDVPIGMIQMLLTIPTFLAAFIAVFSGWLATRLSKKHLVMIGCLITGIAGLLPLLNAGFMLLFVSRMLLGIGLGLVTALSAAIIAEHFEGDERAAVMGLQGASVGTGMLLITTTAGFLGSISFTYAYGLHILGIFATLIIGAALPDTGGLQQARHEKIRLNPAVYRLVLLTFIEFVFVISFSTNIAMHIGGGLAGNPRIAGIIVGAFSAVQILAGLILPKVNQVSRGKTILISMASFSLGAAGLAAFPDQLAMLLAGALLCGFSQGIFVPQAMYEAANAVSQNATTMAAALITVAICLGQASSPVLLNLVSNRVFGEIATGHVYWIGFLVMGLTSAIGWLTQRRRTACAT